MDCPKGMVHQEDECLLLEKTIYGLVQKVYSSSARSRIYSIGGRSMPICMMGPIAMYVDDCLCVGDDKAIKNAVARIGKHFKLKIEETLSDYLSCEILFNKE